MGIEAAIYTYLADLDSVTDEVGTRIYPRAVPQRSADDRPFVTFRVGSEDRVNRNHDDCGGLVEASVEFAVVADDEVAADNAANAIRSALDGYQEPTQMGGLIDVQRVDLAGRSDSYLGPNDGSEFGTYVSDLEFIFWFTETAPTFPAS